MSYFRTLLALVSVSLLMHWVGVQGVRAWTLRSSSAKPATTEKVVVTIVEAAKPKMAPPPPPTPKKVRGHSATKQKTKPKPVFGLAKDSFSESGTSGFQAPVGNTLATQDDGRRLMADQVDSLDQSSDPVLIRDSVEIPAYTQAAVDGGLEGLFVADVFVDADGSVKEAVLRKKAGFGMDERLIAAAKAARYVPRKGPTGEVLSGWAELKFRLEIP